MLHKNRWLLINSKEMARDIHNAVFFQGAMENSGDCADTIGRIINTIELRQK